MKKQFSNEEILTIAITLNKYFLEDDFKLILPIKINFYLQKNIQTFTKAAKLIEQLRQHIGQKYGNFDELTNSYKVESNNIPLAEKEMQDLLEIEQNLDISIISLSDLEGIDLTTQQMQALLFMIED